MSIQEVNRKQIAILVLILMVVTFMPGCSGMQVQTPQDKVDGIYIPPGVYVKYYASQHELRVATGRNIIGTADWRSVPGMCTIQVIVNACALRHELRHCSEGAFHGNMASREAC